MPNEKTKKVGVRIASMLLDHFIMTIGIAIVALAVVGIGFLIFGRPSEAGIPAGVAWIPIIMGLTIFSIYFNKDAVNGRSPAKRILGLVVVDNKTGEIANPIKAFLRNITLVLWPIEVIYSFFSPERRIGDYIAGTKVISDDNTLQTQLKYKQVIIAILLGIVFISMIIALQFSIQGINIFY